jgi:FkbM family methyltransferase
MRWLRDLNVGNRSKRAALLAPFRRAHYVALAGMIKVYPDFGDNLWRYLRGGGEYPYRCRVRTPLGEVAPTLYSSHDISTVTEVFCRQDYRCGSGLRVVVDIGSNIGISGLYFLTRSPGTYVYMLEPVPRNVERLRANLAGFEDRFSVEQVAITVKDGPVPFCIEPTGRYGAIGQHDGEMITVNGREINSVLREIIDRESYIDLLKVDTEDTETVLVNSIADDVLDRIGTIYFESVEPVPIHEEYFTHSYAMQVNHLAARRHQ